MLVNIVYVVKTLQKFSYYVWNTKTKILPRFFLFFIPSNVLFWVFLYAQNMANFEVVFLPRQLHFSINIISLISEMCGIQ